MPVQPVPSSDSAFGVGIDLHRLPWMRRLAVDYVSDFQSLASFFAGDPSTPAAWQDAIARTRAHERDRAGIAAALAAQQERRGAPAAARAAAARLADPSTVAIVTGQQAGLFGGPFFTLLKAVTAIRLADRVTREHGVPAIPVFWIDAEDHDWEEVNHTGVLDANLALQTVTAPPPDGAGRRPVGSLTWDEGISASIESVRAAVPDAEFSAWLIERLAEAYQPGRGVADTFGRLLEALLGDRGLVVYDSSDSATKPMVSALFADELEHAGRTALLAARAGADLAALGYHMQVTPHAGQAALFILDGDRKSLQVEGDTFLVGDTAVSRQVLIDRARTDPGHFSPNVLLRPLVQDTLFPTACYVAGPNELAYLAQLRGVYSAFGLPMPLVAPRATATLVDSAALRFLTKHDISLESMQAQNEQALNDLLRQLLPPSVQQSIDEAEREITARMDAVIAALPAVDPTLEGKARSIVGRIAHELETLRGKVLQAAKRRDDTLRRQYLHTQSLAFPGGEPQERVVSGVSHLARYGPALLARLIDDVPLDANRHWVVAV